MGINVKLATSGIAGVTNLTAGSIIGTADIDVNSVNALQDGGIFATAVDYTVTLPIPIGLIGGDIAEFKNLLTEDPANAGTTREVTVDGNGSVFDGTTATMITTNTTNEVFRLVYANATLGWLVI